MVGVTQSEPEVSDMAQKLVVRPIERIPAYTAPATWSLVQMLLDANAIVQHHKQKASRESTDHHVQPGETTLIGAESDNGSSVEDSDEESVEEDGSQGRHGLDRRVEHRSDAENEALLPIVS